MYNNNNFNNSNLITKSNNNNFIMNKYCKCNKCFNQTKINNNKHNIKNQLKITIFLTSYNNNNSINNC